MDVLSAILNRRSVRSYSEKPIPADVLARLRTALRWAPSARNWQPWYFIFVQDAELKRQLADATNDYGWITQAQYIVAAVGDPEAASKKIGGRRSSVEIDVTIALDHLTLAAAAEGLGTCWIGGFDEDQAKRLLLIPESMMLVGFTPLGYPADPSANHPDVEERRKSESQIFFADRFGTPLP